MNLEVILSVMNLNKKELDKMNITSKCIVINQCGKNGFEKYKNFDIYSYDELGTANSRNRGLEHIKEDIILLCDDDVIYNKDYEKEIIDEFKNNPNADMILFNMVNPYRKKRINKKSKRLHIYNSLNYAAYNVAFRSKSLGNITMNNSFGPGSKYKSGGDDTLFIVSFLKNKNKIYSSSKTIGQIVSNDSTWFKGFDEKFFFDRGALYTAISKKFRHILILQHLIRHKEMLNQISFFKAYKMMVKGSNDYIKWCKNE